MSTIVPVMPPAAKLPTIPRLAMTSFRQAATASETPPAPVWNEKPSLRRPEAAITGPRSAAIFSPSGLSVTRVLPDTI